MPKLAALVLTAAMVVLADASIVDAAAVAAVGTVLNTWLILRHDTKVRAMREELHELRRIARRNRTTTRVGDTDIIVIDPERMMQAVQDVTDDDD